MDAPLARLTGPQQGGTTAGSSCSPRTESAPGKGAGRCNTITRTGPHRCRHPPLPRAIEPRRDRQCTPRPGHYQTSGASTLVADPHASVQRTAVACRPKSAGEEYPTARIPGKRYGASRGMPCPPARARTSLSPAMAVGHCTRAADVVLLSRDSIQTPGAADSTPQSGLVGCAPPPAQHG